MLPLLGPFLATAASLLLAPGLLGAPKQAPPETPAAAVAESFETIYKRIAAEKAKALEAYLAANPNAPDVRAGLGALHECYLLVDDEARQLATLEREYGFLDKSPASDWRTIEGHLYRRVKLLAQSDRVKDLAKAKVVIEQAKKDFAPHAETEQSKRMFAMLEGMVNHPVVGGTLEIAFTALDGTEVDLAAMKGKVVLVDFWATWCGPCVAELPRVKAAYDKFHDQGFEVIGISLDRTEDKAKLQSFIKMKSLPWPQAFEGQVWSDALVVKYGITGIPATFLIGKDGKIAGINVGGHELEAKLAELLK